MSDVKDWKSLLVGIKFVIALVVGLLLVGFLVPDPEPVKAEDFINASDPLGKKLLEVNREVASRYGLEGTTIILTNPPADRQGLYTAKGEALTGKARTGQFFDRISHPELGQTGSSTVKGGHRLCMTWAGRHGEYELLLERLLAEQPVYDGTDNSIKRHLVAFHELGHCIKGAGEFRRHAISNDELKQKVRQVIDVDDEILDRYFSYGKGMPLHQRYLAETYADMFSVEAMIHQANYDRNQVMSTLLESRNKRHQPGHMEYASSLSLVALYYFHREPGRVHATYVMDAMLKEDALMKLDTAIIGSIAERFAGQYQVVDQAAYQHAVQTFSARRLPWSEWRDKVPL